MRLKLLIATVAAATLSVAAATVSASTANAGLLNPITQLLLPTCGSNSYPFAQFGDTSPYYKFSNNGIESGATGWSLTGGAYVGSGNEPWYVNGTGTHSLVLPQGATATSPGFCINLLDPAVRLFAKGPNGGDLKVQVVFHGLTGNLLGILNYADASGTGAWAPTGRISSALALPLLTTSAQIRITAAGGTWQIDDAFVDPAIGRLG